MLGVVATEADLIVDTPESRADFIDCHGLTRKCSYPNTHHRHASGYGDETRNEVET